MHVAGVYVLEVPNLAVVLIPKDIRNWEIFLASSQSQHRKLKWQVSYSPNGITFKNTQAQIGPLKAAEIDYWNDRILLYRGQASDVEFSEFLQYLIKKIVIRTTPNQMHFLVSPKRPSFEMKTTRK